MEELSAFFELLCPQYLLAVFLCCSISVARSRKLPGFVPMTLSLALSALMPSSAPMSKHSLSNTTPTAAIATWFEGDLAISAKMTLRKPSSLSKKDACTVLVGLALLNNIEDLAQSAPAQVRRGSACLELGRIGGR